MCFCFALLLSKIGAAAWQGDAYLSKVRHGRTDENGRKAEGEPALATLNVSDEKRLHRAIISRFPTFRNADYKAARYRLFTRAIKIKQPRFTHWLRFTARRASRGGETSKAAALRKIKPANKNKNSRAITDCADCATQCVKKEAKRNEANFSQTAELLSDVAYRLLNERFTSFAFACFVRRNGIKIKLDAWARR